jgi:hypothetical protein
MAAGRKYNIYRWLYTSHSDYNSGEYKAAEDQENPVLTVEDLCFTIDRTIRNFKIVANYHRACPEGKRWTRADIRDIINAGRYMEDDREHIARINKDIKRYGDPSSSIRLDLLTKIETLEEVCHKVEDLISEREHLQDWEKAAKATKEQVEKEQAEKEQVMSMDSSPGLCIKGAAVPENTSSNMAGGTEGDDFVDFNDKSFRTEEADAKLEKMGYDQEEDSRDNDQHVISAVGGFSRNRARYARPSSHIYDSYRPGPYTKTGKRDRNPRRY